MFDPRKDPNRAARRQRRNHEFSQFIKKMANSNAEAKSIDLAPRAYPDTPAENLRLSLSAITFIIREAGRDRSLSAELFELGCLSIYERDADHALEFVDDAVLLAQQLREELSKSHFGNLFAELMLLLSPLREFLAEIENPIVPTTAFPRNDLSSWVVTFSQRDLAKLIKELDALLFRMKAFALAGSNANASGAAPKENNLNDIQNDIVNTIRKTKGLKTAEDVAKAAETYKEPDSRFRSEFATLKRMGMIEKVGGVFVIPKKS